MRKKDFDHNGYLISQFTRMIDQIMFFQKIEFDKNEISEMTEYYIDGLVYDRMNLLPDDIEFFKDLQLVRNQITILLQCINEGFENSIKRVKNNQEIFKKFNEFRTKYPYYVNPLHPEICVGFYEKLIHEEYNFLETGELLGLTRQTVSKYFNEGIFKKSNTSSRNRISKQSIYLFFVKQNWNKSKKNNIK